eukprot:GILI01020038.1.p1 GENE.GILI01020038.1~~GILI01020038.1.p1  ORF type:complete len:208 (+),score=50.74 GILI01020038.1:74-697(+)
MPVSSEAYVKALLHAMKHPTQPVLGFLLGKPTTDQIYIADAVPVQHTNGGVFHSPTVEIAYMHCQAIGKAQGLSVVGLYAANELVKDTAVSELTKRWAGYLADQSTTAGQPVIVWQINNSLARAENKTNVAIAQYHHNNYRTEVPVEFARWNPSSCNAEAITAKIVLDRLVISTEKFLHMKLWDFEEHLEDVSLDFFNQKLLPAETA